MDINLKIIEAIKDCSVLYKTNASLSQRQQAWSKLALQLNMQEQTLRSRWYLLCESYKRAQLTPHDKQSRNVSFKYAQEMAFLRAHLLQSKPKSIKQDENLPEHIETPEFVITEEDIAKENEDVEEFVFLEVEGLEGSVEVEVNGSQQQQPEEEPMQVQHQDQPQLKSKKAHEAHKTHQQSDNQAEPLIADKLTEHCNATENVIIKTEKVTTTEQEKQLQSKVNIVSDTNEVSLDEKSIAETMSVMSTIKTEPDVNNVKENQSPTDNERCEDVIFGELVTAMLKRMPAEKKRLVKKDIMNALLA